MSKQRIAGIDIIKALAVVFVISIHQIGMTHVLAFNLQGLRPFIIMLFRYTVMSCVPLFLISTGYLQNKKTASRQFYKGIVPLIISYVFVSIFAVFVNVKFCGAQFSVKNAIINILNFTENNYAWYVEMFIGLYLIIPFLNTMYHGLPDRETKKLLIIIFFAITVFPNVAISFKADFLPNYWIGIYPITYYLIGAYFSEYKIKINKILNTVLLFACALIPVLWIFGAAKGAEFESFSYIMNGFDSLSAFAIAVLMFMLFYDVDISFKPVKAVVKDISVSSLEIYLWSNLVEKVVYPYIPLMPLRLFIMIAVIFVLSYICAKLQRGLFYLVKKLIQMR